MAVKTISAKVDTRTLSLFNQICKRKHLIKAKVLESALLLKLEEMAEEEWAIDMLSQRGGSSTMSLSAFEKQLHAIQ